MGAAFTYPGVYIEELSSGQHTITGVATSIAAFVGWAPQGPVDEATLIQSWSDYQTIFGGLDSRSKLGYAVNQFFGNGGTQCYIVRLVWDGSIPSGTGNPAIATTAVASGLGYAVAQFTATVGSVTGNFSLGIGTPTLQSIAITPAAMPPMPVGATVALVANPTYTDGGSTPALSSVTWISSNPSVVTVTGGLATAVGVGTATITATSGFVSGSTTLTVTAATFTSLAISSPATSVAVGETLQLTATANYSDGTSPNITSSVVWSVEAPPSPPIVQLGPSPGLPTPGLVEGLLQSGTPATIQATIPWQIGGSSPSQTASITVEAAAITSVAVYPANPTLEVAATQQLNVWGFFSSVLPNPMPTELTGGSWNWTWTSSNTQVATVSGNTVTAVAVGSATLTATATSGGISYSASTTVTVTAASLKTITITPPTSSLAAGLTTQLTATGVYSDGTSAVLTGSVTWTPSTADIAITPGGLVQGVNAGKSPTVTATFQGVTSNTITVNVTAPVLQSISITAPANVTSIPSGQTLQLSATGIYSGSATPVPITTATWTALTPTLATISTAGLVSAVAAGGSLTLFANNPGAWGNNLYVTITAQAPPNNNRFSILVQLLNTTTNQLQTVESFTNLSVSPTDPQYVVTVIDQDSNYITFVDPETDAPIVPTAAPTTTPTPVELSGGADGEVLVPATDQNFELALTFNADGGVYLLNRVEIFNLLCIPGETDAATISTLEEWCFQKRAFFIVDPPQLSTISGLITSGPVGTAAGGGTPGPITGTYATNAAYYFPWIYAPDPLAGNRPALFPPCGFVAGIYAATDASQGVWKAPAGIQASLSGDSGLQYLLTDAENGSLNPQAINCLREFQVYGDVVWGARTLAGNDQAGSQWKYIPIRRLALFLESSLVQGTQWVVFEPNDERLWGQIRLNVGSFMQLQFLAGAFAGTTPQQAYFVKCDSENNPPASVALGIVNILVGFAPLYPAEFVVIQIQQILAQSSS